MKRTLGVCYYPEHWDEAVWAEDARRMADLGLRWVRVGEFAWSRLEPEPERLMFDWLARAMDALEGAGLRIVLGTPSATPPRWMLDRHPDMLAMDAEGRPRRFGSRRHYCFSHDGYRAEAARIAGLLADRFGDRVAAWQTDNEYGCHDTAVSYSDHARRAFRDWCAQRYGSIDALNRAWGNVFWSMEYRGFADIDPPNLTVTEPNPAHVLAFRRFSSDQIVRFDRALVEAIRAHSDAPVCHNFMGRETGFDHWRLARDHDLTSWDSYPLGFLLDRVDGDAAHRRRYLRQGDPDFQAFHHDLYRAVGHGRWWVMEQQPGPVNWAPHNPAPLPGMVRLWAWEAFAHGAEAVLPFRWRQAPFAQESHHAGLLRPDSEPAPAFAEIRRVAEELRDAPDAVAEPAPVALVFDYESQWAWEAQPQGAGFDHFALCFHLYRALRAWGFDVDVLSPDAGTLGGRALTLIPGLMTLREPLRGAVERAEGHVLTGPRTDLRDPDLSLHVPLGPSLPGLRARTVQVETLPPDAPRPLVAGGAMGTWLEHVETEAEVVEVTTDGLPALLREERRWHLCGWPDWDAALRIVGDVARAAGLAPEAMPDSVRRRRAGRETFVFNYAAEARAFGGKEIPAAGLLRVRGT